MFKPKKKKDNFIKLYDKYHTGIYRFLRFKVKNNEIAQDLTQETFIKYWDYINNKGKSANLRNKRAFLYRIARNLLTDYYRSATKNKEFAVGDTQIVATLADVQSYDLNTAETNLDIGKDMDKVLNVLQDMSELSAQVITLKYVEDMSNAEIAKILDKSEGAVRTAMSRAMKELKSHLS